MSGDLRTMLLETTPADVPDLDVDRLVRRGTRRRRAKRAGATVAALALLTTGSVAVLGPPVVERLPVISQEEPDATAGEWRHLPAAPMSERARVTVATDGDLVAIFGGEVDEPVEVGGTTHLDYTANDGAIYDASRDAWSAIPPAPLPPRLSFNVALAGGQLVVVGGRVLDEVPGGGVQGDGDGPLTLDSVLFDRSTNVWRSLGAPDIAVRTPEVVTWDGTRLVLWGGSGDQHRALMDGATWTAADGWTTIPAAPLEARSGAAVAVAGDRLVVWGGTRDLEAPEDDDLFADGAVFDLVDGSWEATPDGPLSPRWIGHVGWTSQENVRIDGDRILIVGGATTGANHRHDGAWLDLTDGSWRSIAPIPTEAGYADARRGGVIATSHATEDHPYVTLWRYDEQSDRWDRTATRLRSDLEVHHVSPERIVVSSGGDEGQSQDSPRIGIWDAGSPRIVHTHPPLSGRVWSAVAPLPEGVLVWGGLEIDADDGGGRMVGDGARLDR